MKKRQAFRKVFEAEKKSFLDKTKYLFLIVGLGCITVFVGVFMFNYIQVEASDPFVKSLEIEKNWQSSREKAEKLRLDFSSNDSLRNSFHVESITHYARPEWRFFDNREKTKPFHGRSVENLNPILKSIISKTNRVSDEVYPLDAKNDIGLIVTEGMLSTLGLSVETRYLRMELYEDSEGDFNNSFNVLHLPIKGVVKNLPSKSSFVFSPFMFNLITNSDLLRNLNKGSLKIFVENGDRQSIIEKIEGYIINKGLTPEIDTISNFAKWQTSGITINVNARNNSGELIVDEEKERILEYLDQQLTNQLFINSQPGFYKIFDYPRNDDLNAATLEIEAVTANMSDFKKVHAFAQYLSTHYELEPDLSVLKQKDFVKIARGVSLIICAIIFVLILFSTTISLAKVSTTFFNERKRNLGYLQAMGLSDANLEFVYYSLSKEVFSKYILITFLSTLVFTFSMIFLIVDFQFSSISRVDKFYSFLGISILLVLLITVPLYINRQTLKKLSLQTPSELIYG